MFLIITNHKIEDKIKMCKKNLLLIIFAFLFFLIFSNNTMAEPQKDLDYSLAFMFNGAHFYNIEKHNNEIYIGSNKGIYRFRYPNKIELIDEEYISKSEFDATVQDCIDLLLEHDVVDLYDHQLKQIIRCVNTIQKENLSGAQNAKLISLSQELHFQKRMNKIQKNEGNYYLGLNLEFGAPMKERSYYHIR